MKIQSHTAKTHPKHHAHTLTKYLYTCTPYVYTQKPYAHTPGEPDIHSEPLTNAINVTSSDTFSLLNQTSHI
jgi:hypothetical protein